ncbi:MAG: integration host factor subunit beta [Deltaproteobacteria bacterium]|nr:MAG: integration host factor subunit beta [Deltaproteobacteria bacterium]HEX16555.1 integration host factor subunit beta [Deltaproteobacteria bacterium]
MTKRELIQRLAERLGISQKEAKVIVDTVFEELEEALARGERIEVRGFGSFVVRSHNGYTGRNPRTGEAVEVPPKRLPHFKTGKEMRERINRPPGQAKSQ